jgi:DNA-binding NarL/FixJ family response regulator
MSRKAGSPGVPIVDNDPIRRGEPLRLEVTPPPVVRVVLAENESPGPLHYLIESEGFQVVGCASDDAELARVLAQVRPDVIVLDADISATSALIARERAPSSELIVVWPDGVQLPPAAERVHPRLVYQDLGPAIRRAADDRRTRHPTAVEPADDHLEAPAEPPGSVDVANRVAQRTSTRVLVGMTAVIAVIVLTMGASFALEGWKASPPPSAGHSLTISPSLGPATVPSPAGHPSRTVGSHRPDRSGCAGGATTDRGGPNAHAAANARGAAAPCSGRGPKTTHRHSHPDGNHPGNGPASSRGIGRGSAKGNGAAAPVHPTHPSNAPSKVPAGPPATPGSQRSGPPG